MRVLYPCGLFYPSKLGGPANTLYWLAKGLVSKGVEVSVVTSNCFIEEGLVEFDRWIKKEGIDIRYCTARSKFPMRIVRHSLHEMKRCEVVVFSSICYLPNFPIFLKALAKHKKILWSPRGELMEDALRRGSKAKKLYFNLIKVLAKGRILFHATSEAEKEAIKLQFGPDAQVVIIPNLMEIPEKYERAESGNKYFMFLGRIAPIKALDNLIVALSQSKAFLESAFTFKIVGSAGPQFKDFNNTVHELIREKGLQDRVQFTGPVSGADKYQVIANAHYLFLVSHSENFGNVVIESLSQGTPVVASKGTPWQALEENHAGYWISNDVTSISDCIDRILEMDEDEYAKQRDSAYALSREFDVYQNVVKWIAVFGQVFKS